jgi:lantibiotic modifying enzyme
MASDKNLSSLLDGTQVAAVRAVLNAIVVHLDSVPVGANEDYSLAEGAAGLALFYAHLDDVGFGKPHALRAEEYLVRAHDIAASGVARLGLSTGLSGVAWATMHLAGESLPSVEQFLREATAIVEPQAEFDLLSGTAGIALHALRLPHSEDSNSLLSTCCMQLCRRFEHYPGRPWWKELDASRATGTLDLGVAHGIAGVIPILAAAVNSGRIADSLHAQVLRVLEESIAQLLAQAMPSTEQGVFPAEVLDGKAPTGTRLGWCYGDAGIAAALMTTSSLLRRESLRTTAVNLALASCDRAWTGIANPHICHGSAGLAQIFLRFWRATGDVRFLIAARHWVDDLVARAKVALEGSPVAGFLTGLAGAGLVLIAFLGENDTTWDQLLCCSPIHSG